MRTKLVKKCQSGTKFLIAHDKSGKTYRIKLGSFASDDMYPESDEYDANTGRVKYYDKNGRFAGWVAHSRDNPLSYSSKANNITQRSQQNLQTAPEQQLASPTRTSTLISRPLNQSQETSLERSLESYLEGGYTENYLTNYGTREHPITANVVDMDGRLLFHTANPILTAYTTIPMSKDNASNNLKYTQVVNPEFDQIRQSFGDTWAGTASEGKGHKCLATVANWDVNNIKPYVGGDYIPFRELYDKVPLDQYDIDGDNAASSWEVPYMMEALGDGRLIPLERQEQYDYSQFPIGTVFFNGHNENEGNRYLGEERRYDRDDYGNIYPSHTYILGGFNVDNNGTVSPIFMDYGSVSNNGDSSLYKHTPTYAFVRNGSEALLASKLIPKYKLYLLDMENPTVEDLPLPNYSDNWYHNVDLLNVRNMISSLDPALITKISYKYDVPKEELFKRLMAIGELETQLGSSGKYAIKSLLGKSGVVGLKAADAALEDLDHTFDSYDTVPAWRHEIDIYNRLKDQLEGKTPEEIRKLIAEEFNKEKAEYASRGIDYGSLKPSNDIFKTSEGLFLVKADEEDERAFNQLADRSFGRLVWETAKEKLSNVTFGSKSPVKGIHNIEEAYHKLAKTYAWIKSKYPDLTDELVLDAATIAWNAPGKIKEQDFIDNYIKNNILKDNYLEKVKGHLATLYDKKGGGIHLNPKNKGKFTETKKRTGKTTEELTHSKNPLTRKRAIFAQNAKKWKHFLGGKFQGLATDNGIMVSTDKNVDKSKKKIKLIKKQK